MSSSNIITQCKDDSFIVKEVFHFQTRTSLKMIVHEPAMNWQIEKRYFPSFKPLVYILRMYSTNSETSLIVVLAGFPAFVAA